jgi:ligand-binding SRPBCC domain-containing protein
MNPQRLDLDEPAEGAEATAEPKPVAVKMRAHVFSAEQRVARPLPEVFDFFSKAENLQRITPPWLSFSLIGQTPGELRAGTRISYRLRLHGLPIRWVSQIDALEPNRMFVDRQLSGPYKLWLHEHRFEADGDETIVRDLVRYQLPFGLAGAFAQLLFVRRDVERIFDYRHQAIRELLESPGAPVMLS